MSAETVNNVAQTNSEEVQKTPKQIEKELKKQAKLEKFQQKLEKKSAQKPKDNTEKKEKKKEKEQKEVILYSADTKPGEKKDVSCQLPSAYSPKYVEAAWYEWWEKQGFFKPEYRNKNILEPNPRGVFMMVIPPPNVTGTLHLGHALTNSIEDAITRWNRMQGKKTLWVPGCDHAGIATQVVVEKKIWKDLKKTRHDLGREKFIEYVWKWKNEKGGRIYEQLKKLGSSLDWDRACFTMDPKLCKAVNEAFIRLHDMGLIYRQNRLVNWSCALKSAISDIEVDKIELTHMTRMPVPGHDEKVELGRLISFAYKVEGTDEKIVVATTRVETMLGDTAIAVHPEDKRYKHLHGKYCVHPFCDRRIPIIVDTYVDMEFGTGAVKITPAHDPNDYEIGLRHSLPFINIFDDDGCIIGDYGIFTGMKRFVCRKRLIEELQNLGLFVASVDHHMVLPICSRTKDIVEPMLKPQWYVRVTGDMAEHATQAVESGELKIVPELYKKTWSIWMDNIRDWCISRQLWWGHRIPAYHVSIDGKRVGNGTDTESWVTGHNEEEARQKAAKKYNVSPESITLKQDEDVLDTWFSSALFPFSVCGWPDDTPDLKVFYPGTMLETGHDILFFWVARMVFFGQTLMKELPFKQIYLHPIVRDANGRKMSKSLGNVVDPVDVIHGISLQQLMDDLLKGNLDQTELDRARSILKQDYPNGIPECGTDALRFALCAMCQGRDLNLDILRVQGYRHFCNKIWNAVKFSLTYLDGDVSNCLENLSCMDRWILSKMSRMVIECNKGFELLDFPQITSACYNFWLYDFCDVYLECLKPVFQSSEEDRKHSARQTLRYCLSVGLRCLAPFMPFITEELYQRIPGHDISICVCPYPDGEDAKFVDAEIEEQVSFVQRIAKAIRSARSDYNLMNKTKTEGYIQSDFEYLTDYISALQTLSYCSKIGVNEENIPSGCALLPVSSKCTVHLLLRGVIDPEKEIQKLEKKQEQLRETLTKLEQSMEAPDYKLKVPGNIQEANNDKVSEYNVEIERIEQAMNILKLMN